MTRAHLVLAAMLAGVLDERARMSCCVCGDFEQNATGECARCGAYVCNDCAKLHIGEATRACPGNGVDVPEKA